MRTRFLVLALVIAIVGCGAVAVASGPADLAKPHLNKISRSVENITGWDCRPITIENNDFFVAGIICEK